VIRSYAVPLAALFLSACSANLPPRPVGAPTPDPTAADAFATATAACKGFRSIEGELALSGRAGGERVRGRILTGLESGGAVRLEAVAPFGAPFFILAGRNERATLVLPRERRVLKDTGVSEVLERITGLALGAEDLRLILSGCLVDQAAPTDGRQWGGEWKAVTIGADRVAYLRLQNGVPALTAADYGRWHVDYSAHAGGFPRTVRVRRADDTEIDITARIEQLEVNTQINPRAWAVEIPSNADPMTLDELRSIAPLAERK
jgi:outer membrane biogenesis lipoprotein LolB